MPPVAGTKLYRGLWFGRSGFPTRRLLGSMLKSRSGRIVLAFWSHNVLRWIGPVFLIAAFVSNAVLSVDRFYLRCLLLHETLYLVALGGLFLTVALRGKRMAGLPQCLSDSVEIGAGSVGDYGTAALDAARMRS
jgi:hypothetical protein